MHTIRRIRIVWLYWFVLLTLLSLQGNTVFAEEPNEWETEPVLTYPETMTFQPPLDADKIEDFVPPGRVHTRMLPNDRGQTRTATLLNLQDSAISFQNDQVTVFAEADTFPLVVDLAFTPLATNEVVINATRTVTTPLQSQTLYQFQIEALERDSGNQIGEFAKPVRLIVDIRNLFPDTRLPSGNLTLSYRDENDPNIWHGVPTTLHQETGLLSAEVTHFSEWAVGVNPDRWAPTWHLPSVSLFSGAATYNYPIEIPPGRNGHQPNVTLNYNSRGLDGLIHDAPAGAIAHGWSVSQISILRESVKLQSHFGYPSSDHPDKFRLVLNGAGHALYPADPANTTTAPTMRYYAQDNLGLNIHRYYDPSLTATDGIYWVVITPDGTHHRLGYHTQAQETQETNKNSHLDIGGHQGHPNNKRSAIAWHVDTITDPFGNQITYHYKTKTIGEDIDYYANEQTGLMTLTTKQTRIWHIDYNFPSRITTLPPTNTLPQLSNPASRIEFRNPDDTTPARATRPITHIYVYHSGTNPITSSSPPIREYRLTSTDETHETNPGCIPPPGQPRHTRTTQIVTAIRQWANTDNDPTTNDPGYALPATTFTYTGHPHFHDDENDPCFHYFYLTSVNNGYGGQVTFTYQSDNRSQGAYDPEYYPCTECIVEPYILWPDIGYSYTVSETETSDGIHPPHKTTYTYTAPCYYQSNNNGAPCAPLPVADWAPPEVGNLVGFANTLRTDYDSNNTPLRQIDVDFNQDPLGAIGRPQLSETRDPTDSSYSHHTTTTYLTYNNVAGVKFTFANEVKHTQTYNGQSLTHRMGYGISNALQGGAQYGNIVTIHDYGADNTSTDDVTIMRKYYPQDNTLTNGATHWVVNKIAHERILPGIVNDPDDFDNGTHLRESYYDYDNNGNASLPPQQGALTTGWVGRYGDPNLSGSTTGLLITSEFTYDIYGNVKTTAGSSGANMTTITYDSTYNLYPTQVENALGHTTTFDIYGFNGSGPGTFGQARRVPGKLRSVTDPNGIATYFEYDPYGRLFATYESFDDLPPPASNRWGGTEATINLYWDNSWTDPTLWLDPANGNPFGIMQYVHPDTYNPSTVGYLITSFSFYDGWGRPIQGQEHWTEILDENEGIIVRDRATTTSYNALGQVDCTTVPYDISHTNVPDNPYHDPACTSFWHTTYEYDALGRPTVTTTPDGTQTRQKYEIWGFGVLHHDIIDGNHHRTQYNYGSNGRLESVVEILGNCDDYWEPEYNCDSNDPDDVPWAGYSTTTYDYDPLGNLIQVTDHENNTTTLTYDVAGRKISMNDPDMGDWFYEYDEHSNLVRQQDNTLAPNQQIICSYYDDLHRLTRTVQDGSPATGCPGSPVSSGPAHLASYTYDTAPLGTSGATALGLPHTVTWGSDSADNYDTFTYDDRARPASQTRYLDGAGYTMTTLAYNTLHRPTQIQYPAGETVTIGYDREGMNTLTAGSDTLVDDFVFNDRGQPVLLDLGNGVDTTYNYYDDNGNFRLEKLISQKGSNNPLLRLEYEYDNVGNVTQIDDFLNASTLQDRQTFTYDHRNRLLTASGTGNLTTIPAYTHTYDYDEIGNITQRTEGSSTINYQYNDSTHVHAVTSTSGGQSTSFTYDANGNMITRNDASGDFDQVFDVQNRLIEVTDNATNETTYFTYDAGGYRVKTEKPDGTVIYTPYPGYEKEIAGGSWPGGNVPTTYRTTYTFNGQPIATRIVTTGGIGINANDGLYFTHNDHLGSTSVMSTITGAPVANTTARYLPFGDWRTEPTADLTDRGYTSHKHNNMGSDDLGLIYMNARYYVPGIARFASADSIIPNPTNPQSYNRYSYVENRPLNFIDPTGHIGCDNSNLPEDDQNTCSGQGGNGSGSNGNGNPNAGGMPDAVLEIILWAAKQQQKFDLDYILDPDRTEPVVFTLYDTGWLCAANGEFCNIMSGAMHLVFMPFGSSPTTGVVNEDLALLFSVLGFYTDMAELFLIPASFDFGNMGEILMGFVDLGFTLGACVNAGECYSGQPHSSLPSMLVANQDVLVNFNDAFFAPFFGLDAPATLFSAVYDYSSLEGNIPNTFSFGYSATIGSKGQLRMSVYFLIYPWAQ